MRAVCLGGTQSRNSQVFQNRESVLTYWAWKKEEEAAIEKRQGGGGHNARYNLRTARAVKETEKNQREVTVLKPDQGGEDGKEGHKQGVLSNY